MCEARRAEYVRLLDEEGMNFTQASHFSGWTASVFILPKNPSAAALSGEQCFASMFVRQVRQCFSAVWADGFPRCRHRFPVM